MQVDVIQIGVYAFATANAAIAVITLLAMLVGARRVTARALAAWIGLWKLTGVYAVLATFTVGIPTSIDPLSSSAEATLSIACLVASIPAWWLLRRWRQRRRARKEVARATVNEAGAVAEHAARVRRTGRIQIG